MPRQMLAQLSFLLLLGLVSANVGMIGTIMAPDSYETSVEDDDYSVPEEKATKCEKGSYFNSLSFECEFCSECKEFMYIRKECTATTNTQCGWCGSRTIVKNDDFEKKCKTFSMYQQFRRKLFSDFKKTHPDYDYAENDKGFEVIENGKVMVNLDRPDLDDEDRRDLSLADEEDFMKKPLKDKKFISYPSKELTSEEIDEEIKAKEVDEADIGKEEAEDDEEEEHSDSDELPPLPEDDLPEEYADDEEENADKSTQTEEFFGKDVKPWKKQLKEAIVHVMQREMLKEQILEGNYETIKDDDEGTILEVLPPKDEEEKETEVLRRADEIEFLPLKIEVANEENYETPDSSESEEDKDSLEDEILEAKYQRENDTRIQANRRMVRIAVLSITFVVMCWIILSYREKRRKRVFIIPPLSTFTPEQQHMINRCSCKNDAEAKCYENPMAFV